LWFHHLKDNAMNPMHAFSQTIGAGVVDPQASDTETSRKSPSPVTGNVAYTVVFLGYLSMGELLFAIRFSAVKYNTEGNEYVRNGDAPFV
jgi:hypothetical protein